jgi:MoxR-like ATPase
MIESRGFVLPDDVKRLAYPVFAHRLVIARSGGRAKSDARAVLKEILEQVPVPA